MWLSIFIILTILLIALPLMPGIMELQLATDVKPLKVTQDYDSNVKHFAIGFKAYIEKNFSNLFVAGFVMDSQPKEGILRDKTPFILIGSDGIIPLDGKEVKKSSTRRLLIAENNIVMPDNMLFESETYCKASVTTGKGSRFRAILAENDIILGERSVIFRWIHSGHVLRVSRGCTLFGRASAEEEIIISGDANFERLHAKKIIFGHEAQIPETYISPHNLEVLEKLPHVKDQFERRWLINGNVTIPPHSVFDGDIIATKSVSIGKGSVIKGSVKSTRNLVMEEGSSITGSAVSAQDITTSNDCTISGQVIAEGNIIIGSNNRIGLYHHPVTVTSAKVKVKEGTVIFGSVRAEDKVSALIPVVKNQL